MKLTAHQLCVILDTLNHSLKFVEFSSSYTHESREGVRDAIAEIMDEIKLEIVTGTPNPDTIAADCGF